MNRRLLIGGSIVSLAGGLALFACVGDTPVTPVPDAGAPDTGGDVVVKPDGAGDGGSGLLTCQGNETLETFDDPMNLSSNGDLCLYGSPVQSTCNFAGGNGLSYASQALKAQTTTGVDTYALASRSHQQLGTVLARVTEAIVTYEVSMDQFIGDSGWHGFGCLLDQDNVNDAGTAATSISRVDMATNGSTAAAFTYMNGTHAGQTPVPLTGYSSSSPMTVTIRIDRRTTNQATVSLSSVAGTSSVNLNPSAGTHLALWCGATHEAANGKTNVTIRNIRYARCLKP